MPREFPDAIAMQIARVFATDIDFHTDIRKGDRIAVVYEMIYEAGELVAPGRILEARFVNDGRTLDAVLFHDDEGVESYYSLDGTNRAKAFLRSPVEFSRISSGFGARFHPIFKNWRAHTGRGFRGAQGDARARHRRWHGDRRRISRRLWQRDRDPPRRRHHHALWALVGIRAGNSQRHARAPGRS